MKKLILFSCFIALIICLISETPTSGQSRKNGNKIKWDELKGGSWLIPFEIAVARGNVEEVEEYLQAGADPNFVGRPGSTMVDYTALTGNKVILEMLLKAGANPNTRNAQGVLPIVRAVGNPEADLEFMKMLLAVTKDLRKEDVEKVRKELKKSEKHQDHPFTPNFVQPEKIKLIWAKLSMLEKALPQP
ncbi:MAG: hypothetical protein HQM08_28710 [Candidatus Riflebacteria bacterium]|nr:hypothetical protein [Candidatus Riflebacteria bacterium]